tara:strand:+ start:166338 stop:166904 length:567 start_codon:yes stop_codon:yes gene_type:complete
MKKFGFLSSVVYTSLMVPAGFAVIQLAYFGNLHTLIGVQTFRLFVAALIGSIISQVLIYGIEKYFVHGNKLIKKSGFVLVGLSVFCILLFVAISYLQWDIVARRELPNTIPLFAEKIFVEDKTVEFSGYHSRAYEFDYPNYSSISNCALTTTADFLNDDFYERTNWPFEIFEVMTDDDKFALLKNKDS